MQNKTYKCKIKRTFNKLFLYKNFSVTSYIINENNENHAKTTTGVSKTYCNIAQTIQTNALGKLIRELGKTAHRPSDPFHFAREYV